MKAICFCLEDKDASQNKNFKFRKDFISKLGPRCSFGNLRGNSKFNSPHFRHTGKYTKHPRHDKALSGIKATKARLMSEAEAKKKEKPQELAPKKLQAVRGHATGIKERLQSHS